jgi:DNA-binding response OmpR family regulator
MNNKLILIVEDEEDILELLEYTLQKEGYETICFLKIDKNVRNILNEEQIDLILMDRNLPGIEGTSFINEIKQQKYSFKKIYIYFKCLFIKLNSIIILKLNLIIKFKISYYG